MVYYKLAMRMSNLKRRINLFRKQDGKCYYCNCDLTMIHVFDGNLMLDNTITIDHKIPTANGGFNNRKNTVGACSICNLVKGNMSIDKFIKILFTEKYEKLADGYRLNMICTPDMILTMSR